MMDDVFWPALPERHLKRIEHDLRVQTERHGPAHDFAAAGVKDHSQI
jgi:hypothetical protein